MTVRALVNFRYSRISSLSDIESGVEERGYITISTKRRVKKDIQLQLFFQGFYYLGAQLLLCGITFYQRSVKKTLV